MSSLIATADHPDKVKKWLTCLGCSKKMWTDRCHRICKKCRRRNNATPTRRACRMTLPNGSSLEERRGVPSSFDH